MKKKNLLIIIGLIIFIALVGGISYSYFVYNKNIADVSLSTGDIAINLTNIDDNINLKSTIPMTDSEGIISDDYVDFTVTSTVDTEKIYYEVYILPKDGNTLSTEYLKIYLTDQNNTVLTNVTIYDDLPDATIENGKAIYRGIVDLNNNRTTKNETENFRLRLWLDENYEELTAKTFNFDLFLYAKNVADNFRIIPPICRRVTNASYLHTETCNQSSNYCYADGYETITYGTAKDMNTSLVTGDAFDCDVDGSGYNERFYYVSDKWNPGTNINSFDSDVAVLIHYGNFIDGVISNNGAVYHSTDNWHGPVLTNLPKTILDDAWKDTLLKTPSRMIYACNNANCSSTPTLTTNSGSNTIVPNPFNYGNTVAGRLLALPELIKGCKSVNNNTSLSTTGSLKKCNFLFEGTKYSNSSNTISGIWLETPSSTSSTNVMAAVPSNRNVVASSSTSTYGIHPVIEISKEDIEY